MDNEANQRQMYIVVDAIGSAILGIIIRLHVVAARLIRRRLPINDNDNHTFNATEDQQNRGTTYELIHMLVDVLMLIFLTRKLHKDEGGRQVTLCAVVNYIFREHFWFIYLWLALFGLLTVVVHTTNFGVDFSLTLSWLTCRSAGDMKWPGCLIPESWK